MAFCKVLQGSLNSFMYLCSQEEYIKKIIIMRTKITALLVVSLLVSVGCFAKGTGIVTNPFSVAEELLNQRMQIYVFQI